MDHALKIRAWFGYNPHFNCYHFFEIFRSYAKKVHVVWINCYSKVIFVLLNYQGGGHKFSEFACLFLF